MAPKLDRIYSQGRSNIVTPFNRVIICSDDEYIPENVPQSTHTPTHVACPIRDTPTTMEPRVVSASHNDRERILTYSPSVLAAESEGEYCSLEASGLEKAYVSLEALVG